MPVSSSFLRPYATAMAEYSDLGIYHQACALTIMGALLTRTQYRCILEQGVPRYWTNLWVVLVGDSGSGKSTAISMAEQVLKRVDDTIAAPDDGSQEGFLSWLDKRQSNANDPSCVFVQSEFTTMLMQLQKQYAQSLKGTLLKFFDVPPSHTIALKRLTVTINQPRVSLLGGISTELLAKHSSEDDWLGGFFNRCIILTREGRLSGEPPVIPDEVYDRLAVRLRAMLRVWRNAQVRRKRALFPTIKDAKKYIVLPEGDEQNQQTILARARSHLARIAALEQIDEDPEAEEIGAKALQRASNFIGAWAKDLPPIVDACWTRGREEFEGDKLAKKILRYLRKANGPVWRRDVLRNCSLHVDQADKALRSLQQAELVKVEAMGKSIRIRLLRLDEEAELEAEMKDEDESHRPH